MHLYISNFLSHSRAEEQNRMKQQERKDPKIFDLITNGLALHKIQSLLSKLTINYNLTWHTKYNPRHLAPLPLPLPLLLYLLILFGFSALLLLESAKPGCGPASSCSCSNSFCALELFCEPVATPSFSLGTMVLSYTAVSSAISPLAIALSTMPCSSSNVLAFCSMICPALLLQSKKKEKGKIYTSFQGIFTQCFTKQKTFPDM